MKTVRFYPGSVKIKADTLSFYDYVLYVTTLLIFEVIILISSLGTITES